MSKKVIALVLAVLFISLCLGPAVLAENEENSGSSSGKTPLLLEQAFPADNDLGVVVDVNITLTFSKNIVNMS